MKQKKPLVIYIPEKHFTWHNEDAWLWSDELPMYAVADGVTMEGLEEAVFPTGSEMVADLFCKKAIEFLEGRYAAVTLDDVREAYKYANDAIRDLNATQPEVAAAVASTVVVGNGRILGSRIADCGFALVRKGNVVFKTPEFWAWSKEQGRQGYGKLDGQSDVRPYVDVYDMPYEPGDTLLLFSDGFEEHFGAPEFAQLFKARSLKALDTQLRKLDARLIEKDNGRYGKERTLVVVELS